MPITIPSLAAPLPAQPAEVSPYCKHGNLPGGCFGVDGCNENWHPTSTLPSEGSVVELRRVDGVATGLRFGMCYRSEFVMSCYNDGGWIALNTTPREWRYPPGERAEATINADQRESKAGNSPQSIRVNSQRSQDVEPADALPELRSAVLAREVTDMRRALRGRAPWPVEDREPLKPLLASAFRVWK